MAPPGDTLSWRESGDSDRPVVVCLHGQFLDGSFFDALRERLAGAWRVLVPDLPGYGRSALLDPYSLEGVRAALAQDLGARGLREVAVVAGSLGCYHALGMALDGRVRVGALVLLGPIAGADPEVKAAFAGYARAIAGGMDVTGPLLDLAFPAAWAAAHPAQVASLRIAVAQARRETLVTECETIARMADLRPELHRIRAPALVRVGDVDRSTPPAWAEAIARAIPGAELEVVPGLGHLPLVQDEEATVGAVERFLSRTRERWVG